MAGFEFKMRQLEKPEYFLLKALKEKYNLDDSREVLIIGLRMLEEVSRYGQENNHAGKKWLANVISSWRTQKGHERIYILDGMEISSKGIEGK